ncbi:hypothetical protein OAH18_02050 [bacterium]|nr:hypothetical protein [bacterium]
MIDSSTVDHDSTKAIEQIDSGAKHKWWQRPRFVVVFVLVQPILYVLSLGPAIVLHQNAAKSTQGLIERYYSPLVYWMSHNLPGHQVLEAYARWWRP